MRPEAAKRCDEAAATARGIVVTDTLQTITDARIYAVLAEARLGLLRPGSGRLRTCGLDPQRQAALLEAVARLRVPPDVPADDLRDLLEKLANELMVDINLDQPTG